MNKKELANSILDFIKNSAPSLLLIALLIAIIILNYNFYERINRGIIPMEFTNYSFIDRLSTTWLVLTVKQKQKIKSDFETDLGSAPPLSLLHNHHHQEMNPDSSELQVVTKEGKCLVCGKVFANSQNARRHAREIHLESTSEYKCHICGSTYGRNRAYKEHMGKVHGLYRKMPRLQS